MIRRELRRDVNRNTSGRAFSKAILLVAPLALAACPEPYMLSTQFSLELPADSQCVQEGALFVQASEGGKLLFSDAFALEIVIINTGYDVIGNPYGGSVSLRYVESSTGQAAELEKSPGASFTLQTNSDAVRVSICELFIYEDYDRTQKALVVRPAVTFSLSTPFTGSEGPVSEPFIDYPALLTGPGFDATRIYPHGFYE